MSKKKIATILGARPQFVKASVLSKLFIESEYLKEIIIHTGQHYNREMSDFFFEELNIPEPAYNLGIGGGTHGENTGRMIEAIEKIFIAEKPDCVIVYGDTDSTLAGTIAAAKLYIPIFHVEAGLRSFNNRMPEEINRILTDRISSLLFVPTGIAYNNLLKEGIEISRIKVVGDIMYDAVLNFSALAAEKSHILHHLNIEKKQYILSTIHRPVNTDSVPVLQSIFAAFKSSKYTIVFPVHPRTLKVMKENLIDIPANVKLIDPVGYLDMLELEKNAGLIITDSGGVQKEAFFHKVQCITIREETEWKELVDIGVNILVGNDFNKLENLLRDDLPVFSCENDQSNLYGDGRSGEKMRDEIISFFLA